MAAPCAIQLALSECRHSLMLARSLARSLPFRWSKKAATRPQTVRGVPRGVRCSSSAGLHRIFVRSIS